MSDRQAYYRRAQDWAADTRAESAQSRRIAWTVAGVAVGAALFEAVALAMLAPLKTVEPVTILVDRQTGYVQALDPLTPRRVAADDALTSSFLAQYVMAREGFDRATVSNDYRRVALWSAGSARRAYLSLMPATNPASPFQRYPAGTLVTSSVKSVSRIGQGVALVRFDTQEQGRSGQTGPRQPWISVVRFRYVDAPMSLADRLINPLGFQVTGYRRDAEAPPPPTSAPEPASGVLTSSLATPEARQVYLPRPVPGAAPAARRPVSTSTPAPYSAAPAASSGTARSVPLSQLPMGSPLSPGPTAVADAS